MTRIHQLSTVVALATLTLVSARSYFVEVTKWGTIYTVQPTEGLASAGSFEWTGDRYDLYGPPVGDTSASLTGYECCDVSAHRTCGEECCTRCDIAMTVSDKDGSGNFTPEVETEPKPGGWKLPQATVIGLAVSIPLLAIALCMIPLIKRGVQKHRAKKQQGHKEFKEREAYKWAKHNRPAPPMQPSELVAPSPAHLPPSHTRYGQSDAVFYTPQVDSLSVGSSMITPPQAVLSGGSSRLLYQPRQLQQPQPQHHQQPQPQHLQRHRDSEVYSSGDAIYVVPSSIRPASAMNVHEQEFSGHQYHRGIHIPDNSPTIDATVFHQIDVLYNKQRQDAHEHELRRALVEQRQYDDDLYKLTLTRDPNRLREKAAEARNNAHPLPGSTDLYHRQSKTGKLVSTAGKITTLEIKVVNK